MKTYYISMHASLLIDAESEEEARQKYESGKFDNDDIVLDEDYDIVEW